MHEKVDKQIFENLILNAVSNVYVDLWAINTKLQSLVFYFFFTLINHERKIQVLQPVFKFNYKDKLSSGKSLLQGDVINELFVYGK